MEYLFLIKAYLHIEPMITLIGTGHVFNLKNKIEQIIHEKNPDIVCVELDKKRYNALLLQQKQNHQKNNTPQPFIYRLLAKFQDNAAKWYGVHAGDEMLTAIQTAEQMNIPVEFIDMDAQVLFKKMLKTMPTREKIRLILSSIGSLFATKNLVEKEMEKLQDNYEELMNEIGKKFPTIKNILIDKRNEYMVKRLQDLTENYGNIIAIVGDGHVQGMKKLIESKNIEVQTVRLKDLTKNKNGNKKEGDTVSFTVTYTTP